MNKLQRILCMVLSAILLLTWMPAVAEEAPEAPEAAEAAEAAETDAEEEADIEVDFPDELISTFYGWTDAEWEANDLGSKMKSINDARSVLESYDIDLDYVPENMVRLYNFPANCIVFDESISIPLDDSRINIYYDVESDEFSYQMKNIRNLNGITDWENRIKWNLSKDNTHFLSKSRGNLVFPSSTYKYMDGDEQVRAGYVSFFEIGDENFMVYCENSNYDLDLGYNPEIIGLSLKWIRRI